MLPSVYVYVRTYVRMLSCLATITCGHMLQTTVDGGNYIGLDRIMFVSSIETNMLSACETRAGPLILRASFYLSPFVPLARAIAAPASAADRYFFFLRRRQISETPRLLVVYTMHIEAQPGPAPVHDDREPACLGVSPRASRPAAVVCKGQRLSVADRRSPSSMAHAQPGVARGTTVYRSD